MSKELPNEQQLFYSLDGSSWKPSLDGARWSDEKCEGYLYKHLTWDEFQAIINPPSSIDELRSAKKSELRSTCESKINAGFIADVLFPDCNYRNDRDQQNNIRDCALGDGGYIWMNEDFTHHTKTQAQSIYALSRSEVQSHKLKYANKCEYLNDPSRTAEEIQAVTWDSVE